MSGKISILRTGLSDVGKRSQCQSLFWQRLDNLTHLFRVGHGIDDVPQRGEFSVFIHDQGPACNRHGTLENDPLSGGIDQRLSVGTSGKYAVARADGYAHQFGQFPLGICQERMFEIVNPAAKSRGSDSPDAIYGSKERAACDVFGTSDVGGEIVFLGMLTFFKCSSSRLRKRCNSSGRARK